MDSAKLTTWFDQAQPILVAFGLKVIGAVAVFMIGRWLIHLVTRLVGAAMTRQELDPSVQRYLVSFITVALNTHLGINLRAYGFNIISFWGLTITYLFFQIPLMILIITPALDGLKREWREAACRRGDIA